MTADEFTELVLSSENPHDYSVNHPDFQKLTEADQQIVVRRFDGYGLRNKLAARARAKKR